MYNGLEVRVPFCDYRIAEYLYSVPWEFKDYRSYEKGLLREAMKDYLPDKILWRKKSPYPKTHNPLYFKLCSAAVKDILSDKGSPLYGILDPAGVNAIIEHPEKKSSPWYGQLMRAPQILAYIAEIDYWFKKYNVEIV